MDLTNRLRQFLPPTNAGYKPKAIRIQSLLTLFFIFLLCLTSIELLIERTRRPLPYLGIPKYGKAEKLEQCPAPAQQAAVMASLSSQSSSLCSQYTTVYKPFTTSLTPALMTGFDNWLDIYNSVSSASENAAACSSSASSASLSASVASTASAASASASNSAASNSASNSATTNSAVSNTAAANSASNSAGSNSAASTLAASNTAVSNSVASNSVAQSAASNSASSLAAPSATATTATAGTAKSSISNSLASSSASKSIASSAAPSNSVSSNTAATKSVSSSAAVSKTASSNSASASALSDAASSSKSSAIISSSIVSSASVSALKSSQISKSSSLSTASSATKSASSAVAAAVTGATSTASSVSKSNAINVSSTASLSSTATITSSFITSSSHTSNATQSIDSLESTPSQSALTVSTTTNATTQEDTITTTAQLISSTTTFLSTSCTTSTVNIINAIRGKRQDDSVASVSIITVCSTVTLTSTSTSSSTTDLVANSPSPNTDSSSSLSYIITTLSPAPLSADATTNATTSPHSTSSVSILSSSSPLSTSFANTTTTHSSNLSSCASGSCSTSSRLVSQPIQSLNSSATSAKSVSDGQPSSTSSHLVSSSIPASKIASSSLIQSSSVAVSKSQVSIQQSSSSSISPSSTFTSSSSLTSSTSTSASASALSLPPTASSQGVLRRQATALLSGNETFGTPVVDAWNYLIWTSALGVRRTTSGVVTTTTAAVFTLDVFSEPDGELLTSWPTFTATPVLAMTPTTPACIPVTVIQPAAIATGGLLRRDDVASGGTKAVKPYATRDGTTVVILIRDNYLDMQTALPTITQAAPAAMLSAVPSGMYATVTQYTSLVQTTDSHGHSTSYSVVVVKSTTVSGTPDATVGANATPASTWTPTPLAPYERVVNPPFRQGTYFAALYLAPVLAVLVKIGFEAISASNKMMEPFERLHCEAGSNAERSLFSQYLESSVSFDAFRWVGIERSLPLWTILMYGFTTIAAPLASSAMSVRPMDTCFINEAWRKCDPSWIVNMDLVRVLEVIIVICMALTCLQLYCSWFYHAGVPSNPTSIASMAVLLNYEPLIQTLRRVEGNASEEELLEALKPYQYWLTTHSQSPEETRYGLVARQNVSESGAELASKGLVGNLKAKAKEGAENLKGLLPVKKGKGHLMEFVHVFAILVLLSLLTTYRADLSNNAFNVFFTSDSYGPKFIMVVLGSLTDSFWKDLEREVRIVEPYRRMSYGNARPEATILMTLNGSCWTKTHKCFEDLFRYPHMWFQALIGFTACLSDVNIIALSGVLMSDSQTEVAYQFSSITASCITSYMLVVAAITMLWWKKTPVVSSMPRKPETVAVVLSYLCSSRMVRDIAAARMEHMSSAERDAIIIASGRRYKFGLVVSEEDERERWCVDYDDTTSESTERNVERGDEKNPYVMKVQYI